MADYLAIESPQTPGLQASRSQSKPRASPAVLFVRFLVFLLIATFVFGNIATWAPLFEINLVNTIMVWWNGYPHGGGTVQVVHGHHSLVIDTGPYRNITLTGHTEFIRPTFLMLFCIIPFFLSLLAIELLRHIGQMRRVTSAYVWKLAMIMRRKPRIPALGVSRYSWGEWIFGVVFVIGGNILCFYYEWDRRIDNARAAVADGTGVLDTTKYWNIIGISCAYLCIYNMAFLLLPVTRNSAWMEFFNISYTNGARLHRWMGYATVITGVIHTVGYWVKWVRDGTWTAYQIPCAHCDISDEYTGYYAWFNFFGFISVLALVLMIPTSIPVVRRKVYEWFYITHWVLFVIAVIFAILHWSQIIWWIFPSGLVFFISRASSSWNSFTPVPVQEMSVLGEGEEEIVKIVLKRAAQGSSPASADYDFKVGNFVYLNVPELSKIQWHALTIASSSKSSPTDFTLLVKPLGDWSQQLAQYAKKCNAEGIVPRVYIDGFYGASLEMYEDYPTLLLVGGGIGVTPLLAILEDLVAKVRTDGVWTQHVLFVMTFRELTLLRSLSRVLTALRELDPKEQFFQTRLYVTRTPSEASLNQVLMHDSFAFTNEHQKPKMETSERVQQPFYEPLRSSIVFRCALYVVLYAVATFVVGAAKWGNGAIQGDSHPTLWPLERAFELAVFTATIVVVYAFIWYESMTYRKSATETDITGVEKLFDISKPAGFADIHSVRDLVQHFNVALGERPNMQSILMEAVAIQSDSSFSTADFALPVVGIMISGPESLKIATNEAAIALGSSNFDVHEEEFEL